MKEFVAFVAAFVLSAVPVLAQQTQEGQDRHGDTVSFNLQQNVIFVEVRINGQGPFTFIFDTGASVTLLRRQTAEQLNLDVQRPGGDEGGMLQRLLENFGMSPGLTTLQTIGLGDAQVGDLEVAVMNVPQAELPLQMAGINYDGIIGYNFISRFETTINYRERTIRLTPVDYDPGPAIPELSQLMGQQQDNPPQRPNRPRRPRPQPQPAAPAQPETPRADARAWIGFTYRTVGDDEANEIGVEGGIVVTFVAENSPAAQAGLQNGDVVLQVGETRIRNADDYRGVTRAARVGQELALDVLRSREHASIHLIVGSH